MARGPAHATGRQGQEQRQSEQLDIYLHRVYSRVPAHGRTKQRPAPPRPRPASPNPRSRATSTAGKAEEGTYRRRPGKCARPPPRPNCAGLPGPVKGNRLDRARPPRAGSSSHPGSRRPRPAAPRRTRRAAPTPARAGRHGQHAGTRADPIPSSSGRPPSQAGQRESPAQRGNGSQPSQDKVRRRPPGHLGKTG
jgi:hypothetical protein